MILSLGQRLGLCLKVAGRDSRAPYLPPVPGATVSVCRGMGMQANTVARGTTHHSIAREANTVVGSSLHRCNLKYFSFRMK